MAKTIILFLALLFTGATTYFSWTNMNNMKSERVKIHDLEDKINRKMTDIEKTRGDTATRRGEQDAETRKKGEQTADRDSLLEEISTLKAQVPQLDDKIASQETEIKKYEDAIAELKKFFESMDVNSMEELQEKIKELQGTTVAREKELAETQALVEGANAAINKLDEQLTAGHGRQMDRSRGIRLNTSEAVIQAVNADWGFVVINAGESQGYRGDNTLIVKRGDTYIAKLAITSLSKNQMVADILPKSVVRGMSVMPGDRVILEKPNR